MEDFFHLFRLLDETTATEAKLRALQAYFLQAPAADAAWALHVLLGRQKRRLITSRRLREICLAATPWPPWLFDACYRQVGDSAETISLLWRDHPQPPPLAPLQTASSGGAPAEARSTLQDWMEGRLPSLAALAGDAQAEAVRLCWQGLGPEALLVVNKLLTGGLRVGVSEGLVMRALARLSGLEEATLKHRLMGEFRPSATAWQALLSATESGHIPPSRPYPFFLASPLEATLVETTPASQWQVEWKYDGIRCQLIRRQGEVFLWSRGEDLINASFPDLTAAAADLPDGLVLDGEVVIWAEGERHPRPFAALQRRLNRLKPGKPLLQQSPACFVAYDLLEHGGEDQRPRPLQERRLALEVLLSAGRRPPPLRLAPLLPLGHWHALSPLRDRARQEGAEGVMVKRRDSPYLSGRRRGHWWKHKLEPYRLDAVLLYAQAGSGRRANLYTDYTFGLWDRPWRESEGADRERVDSEGVDSEAADRAVTASEAATDPPRLVTFAKAYSGLDDKEILRLDQWIRAHTVQRYGPVRAVEPLQVFELAFEGLQRSSRHRSGIAVRFPRISRWRSDKPAREADSLAEALALLVPPADGEGSP